MSTYDLAKSINNAARCENPDTFIRRIRRLPMDNSEKAEVCFWLLFDETFINHHYSNKLQWAYATFKQFWQGYMSYSKNWSRVCKCIEFCGTKPKKYLNSFKVLCEVSTDLNLPILREINTVVPTIVLNRWTWEHLNKVYNITPTSDYINRLIEYELNDPETITYLNRIILVEGLGHEELNHKLAEDNSIKELPLEVLDMITGYVNCSDPKD